MGYESVGVGWLPRLEEKRRGNLWSEQPWKVVESGRTEDIGTGGGDKAQDGKQQFSSIFHG